MSFYVLCIILYFISKLCRADYVYGFVYAVFGGQYIDFTNCLVLLTVCCFGMALFVEGMLCVTLVLLPMDVVVAIRLV